jgi:hypothetical protein
MLSLVIRKGRLMNSKIKELLQEVSWMIHSMRDEAVIDDAEEERLNQLLRDAKEEYYKQEWTSLDS